MKRFIRIYNYIRISISILYVLIGVTDIYGSFIDKETYERVYVGEYFYSMYASINMFRILSFIFIVLSAIYIYSVVLHISKLRDNKTLSVSLIITDILFVTYRVFVFLNTWY